MISQNFVKTPILALQAVSLGRAEAHIDNLAAATHLTVILLWNRRLSREINRRRRVEDRLAATQFAIDHFSDAAFRMGPDAQFVYVNQSACRALGYSEKELLS